MAHNKLCKNLRWAGKELSFKAAQHTHTRRHSLAQTHGRSQSRSGPEAFSKLEVHKKRLSRSLAPDTVEIQMSSQMCCLWLFDSLRVGSLSFNDVKRERERVGQKLNKRKNLCACMLQRDEVNIWEAQHAQPHRYEVLLFFRHRQKSRMCVWISQGVVACFCFSVSFLCTQMMMSNLVPGACFCNEWDHQFWATRKISQSKIDRDISWSILFFSSSEIEFGVWIIVS